MWKAGETLGPFALPITRELLVRYAGASGDYNPIHYDDDYARSLGLPGVIAHGMLIMGLAVGAIRQTAPLGSRLEQYGVRFRAVVEPNQTLQVWGSIASVEPYDGDWRAVIDVRVLGSGEAPAVTGRAVLAWTFGEGQNDRVVQ